MALPRIWSEEEKKFLLSFIEEHFEYDNLNGGFLWKKVNSNRVKVGDRVGSRKVSGYYETTINGQIYPIHRLVWFYHKGVQPNIINHSPDKNRGNNRIENLQSGTYFDNNRDTSMKGNNTSGHMGISWDSSREKWYTSIKLNNRNKYLGRYDDLPSAILIRCAAEILFDYSDSHGT